MYKGKVLKFLINKLEDSPGYMGNDIEMHEKILASLRSKDVKRTRYFMKKHIDIILECIE